MTRFGWQNSSGGLGRKRPVRKDGLIRSPTFVENMTNDANSSIIADTRNISNTVRRKRDRPAMSQQPETTPTAKSGHTSRRFFARYYERISRSNREQSFMNPLRKEVTGQARGLVLEIGAGNGLNFAFYDPDTVERVEATEPDSAMLGYARERAAAARVP